MADRTAHELAELAACVLPELPCPVSCIWDVWGDVSHIAALVRLEDRYLLRCSGGCPAPGGRVTVYVTVERFVYTLLGAVTGVAGSDEVVVTLDSVRRKAQRRSAPRTLVSERVVLSEEGEVEARLLDVGPDGFASLHDRRYPIGAKVEVVLHLGGVEIPLLAVVRNVKRCDEGRFRVGCLFLALSEEHREVIRSAAAPTLRDRRIGRLRSQGGLGRWGLSG